MSSLEQFRREKDAFMRSHPQSPLTPLQRASFTGLRYFPEDPSLHLELSLDTQVPHERIVMETSTGDQQGYVRAGKGTFVVEDQPVEVFLYQDEQGHEHEFFIPFRDATSGHESYGAGRYLEAEFAPDGTVLLDFNYAYNPYCAYNETWSCPIPPGENWLKVPIRAGEMSFQEGH